MYSYVSLDDRVRGEAIAVTTVVTTVWLLAHLSWRELAAVGGTVIVGTLYRVAHSRRADHNKLLSD